MLRDLQRDFKTVALTGNPAVLAERVIAARGTGERRLGVYRTNTLNSLTDVLRAAFPVVERIVGARFFRGAAAHFIEARPPHQPVLYRYGAELPDFLADFPPAADLPYLADVARLEWARIDSYFAADAAALEPARLAAVAPEDLEHVRFSIHPGVRLVSSPFPVFEVWAVNQADRETVPPVDFTRPEQGLVLRRANEVINRQVEPAAIAWLRDIADGAPLAPATAAASAIDPAFDLQAALHLFLADGVFTDVFVDTAESLHSEHSEKDSKP